MSEEETASEAMIRLSDEADIYLARIAWIRKTQKTLDRDDITWGHVGSIGYMARQLRTIVDHYASVK